ncbi:MAG: efflux RND transporter periplasmic adaptor subunit [Gammaproteobacteria bacterium]|jgi:RND family efflux transporter MFP subunit|nr:efflux RND transporter periplasmic adaptor subunit [Gammaproteobacteria bacterium]MDP6616441.1 efflux RND transporter periplasmic adaptor subunit [Gammaproteobacteria bacterium]
MRNLFEKLLTLLGVIVRRPLLIVLVTVIMIAILVLTRPRLVSVESPERVWPVDVIEVHKADEQPMLDLSGQVISGRRSELRALVPGPIVEVGHNFREGARVSKGELLVQIDPFEYRNDVAEQKALLVEAEVDLEIKLRDEKRIRELFEENNISEQAMDDATLVVEQRRATLEQRRIGLARAERALRDARLSAPYDGLVNGVSADLGKQLSQNDKVAEIIDTGRLEVRFSLSKSQFGRILESDGVVEGKPVEVSWQVGNETLIYSAVVERIGAEIDSTTGGVGIYAVINQDTETLLRPGAFVWARIPDKMYTSVFRVPESALYGSDSIYVVKNDRLKGRTIKVEGYAGDNILFSSAGEPAVEDGDLVVITQIREGGAGVKVEIR